MKKHKGLTVKKSIITHGLQQLSAFILFTCCFLLIFYSVAGTSYSMPEDSEQRVIYDINLLDSHDRFEDTQTFDDMLIKTIKEIIRYNVAKSQLETEGMFDGSKIIDINAFVNRKNDLQNSMESIPESDVGDKLSYSLEDLIKWKKYGMIYNDVALPVDTFVTFFGDKSLEYYDGILTDAQKNTLSSWLPDNYIIEMAIVEYGEDDIYLHENEQASYNSKIYQALADILQQTNVVNSILYDSESGEIMVHLDMLEERYRPVNGGTLLAYAKSWLSYQNIMDYLTQAVEDISYNYNEYLSFKEKYDKDGSNIKYTFKMMMMGEPVEVDNLDVDVTDKQLDAFYSSKYGKYVIYRPKTMYFESNTGIINESTLFKIFNDYEYAYPETAQIWIAVDTEYPVNDPFKLASGIYGFIRPNVYMIFGIGMVAISIWFILFLYISVITGYRKNKDEDDAKLVLHWLDSIPTEIMTLMGFCITAFILFIGYEYNEMVFLRVIQLFSGKRFFICVLLGILGMLCSILFCIFWYSLLRRIKAHTLWKESILRKLWFTIFVRLFTLAKKPVLKYYDNLNIWVRGFLYLGTVMLFNFCFGILCYRSWRASSLNRLLIDLFFWLIVGNGLIMTFWINNRIKQKRIVEGIKKIRDGDLHYQVSLEGMHGDNKHLSEAVNSIGEGLKTAVETSMKDERLKADLITNVSHDIKTPLTSIINYVNLLKRENIETQPVKGYIDILENKSQRLKQLTEDLLEASKISSGNITLHMEKINLVELIYQAIGEFSEKFEEKNLSIVDNISQEAVYIEADSRRIWRVIENLFNNIYKYALVGTRVYLDLIQYPLERRLVLSIKNISSQPLNIKAEELTERFIRGDVSRNTEGSGLGLSIAKNLTELQHGKFQIYLDGDLFKITLEFSFYEERE